MQTVEDRRERREEKTEEFLILSVEKIKHSPKHILKCAGEGKVP